MLVAFTLTMPNCGSWDGRWSGEGRIHCRVFNYRSQKAIRRAQRAVDGQSYYYSWGDGWGASVSVREVTAAEARRLRRKSCGFAGYDWMIRSILEYGRIMADHEEAKYLAEKGA